MICLTLLLFFLPPSLLDDESVKEHINADLVPAGNQKLFDLMNMVSRLEYVSTIYTEIRVIEGRNPLD